MTVPECLKTAEGEKAFRPSRWLASGHVQTLAGVYLPARSYVYRARQHHVALADGDQIVLHDDHPQGWTDGDRVVMLIHGLAGCHQSGYMRRIAARLAERHVRVFRMDLRGCGAGFGLARRPYHGGRSDDVAAAIELLSQLAPRSPVTVVGFSLGGNIALKLLGESADAPPGGLDSVMAICPPIDLGASARRLHRRWNRLYDRHFVSLLWRGVVQRSRRYPDLAHEQPRRAPRGIVEFDDVFTAPVCGFASGADYYARASSAPVLERIRRPVCVLVSDDDPLVELSSFQRAEWPAQATVCLTRGGGHLGFVARRGDDPDRRWMDWRVVEWVESQPRKGG